MSKKQRSIDETYDAIRPRLAKFGVIGGGGVVIPPLMITVSELDGSPTGLVNTLLFDQNKVTGGFTLAINGPTAQIGIGPYFLLLDGSRPMEGNLQMGYHDITNLRDVVSMRDIQAMRDIISMRDINDVRYIQLIDALEFDTAPSPVHPWQEGTVLWSDTEKRLVIDVHSGVELSFGGVYARVRNTTGATIFKGFFIAMPENMSGTDVPAVAIADASDATLSHALGMVMADIPDNEVGWVCIDGLVRGLDTSFVGEGAQLFLDPTGTFVTDGNQPLRGCGWQVRVGKVVTQAPAPDGVVYVHIEHVPKLDELSDVAIGEYAPKQYYDVPMWLPPPAGESGSPCDAWRDFPASRYPITSVSADYDVLTKDVYILVDASGGPVTISLPSQNFEVTGRMIYIKKIDSTRNHVIIDGNSFDIDGESTFDLILQGEEVPVMSDGTNWWIT